MVGGNGIKGRGCGTLITQYKAFQCVPCGKPIKFEDKVVCLVFCCAFVGCLCAWGCGNNVTSRCHGKKAWNGLQLFYLCGGDPPRTLSKYQRDWRGSLFGQTWDPISPQARVSRRGEVPQILSENRVSTAVVSLVQPVVKSAHFFRVRHRRKISVLTNGKNMHFNHWQVEIFFSLLESECSGNFFPLSMCFGKTRFLSRFLLFFKQIQEI